jgi:hypothetical protein
VHRPTLSEQEDLQAPEDTMWTLQEVEDRFSAARSDLEASARARLAQEGRAGLFTAQRVAAAAGIADALKKSSPGDGTDTDNDGASSSVRRRGGQERSALADRLERRGTESDSADAVAAAMAASDWQAESGRWVTASVVVAGQGFDLEFWLHSDGTVAGLESMSQGFCQAEWELLQPLLGEGQGMQGCSATIQSLLQARAAAVFAGDAE